MSTSRESKRSHPCHSSSRSARGPRMRRGAAAAVLCLFAAASRADTLHVPAQYATIQAAIDAASSGDTVLIADGIYQGLGNFNLDFGGKSITVAGENGPDKCIIECESKGRGFWFHSGETDKAVVRGLTVRHGAAAGGPLSGYGGAVACEAAGPTIRDCRFIVNRADREGGAIYAQDSVLRLENCLFEGNVSRSGGAVSAEDGSLTLIECTLRDNTADGGVGGGLLAENATLDRCTVSGNTADSNGGGVSSWRLTAIDSTFIGNFSGGHGGAADAHRTVMVRCRIRDNQTDGVGGGVRASWLSDEGSVFIGNRASEAGGAFVSIGPLLLVGSRFEGNVAENGAGGGLLAHEIRWRSAEIRNCLFIRNVAQRAGDWGPAGGAIAMANNHHVSILGCTIVGNEAVDGTAISASRVGSDPFQLTIHSCIIRGKPNLLLVYELEPDVAYSNVQGGWPGEGNIDADPRFVDPESGDYRLLPGSPCIDAGDTLIVPHQDRFDAAGAARFVDDAVAPNVGVPDPLRPMIDMGAYEHLSRDCNLNGVDDAEDIAGGFSSDCNANGLPDECEVDCDGNGVADDCDLIAGRGEDCNDNRLPDACDIAFGLSEDINANGRPDECDRVSLPGDLNCDLFIDALDIEPFVLSLVDEMEYYRRYDCSTRRGDINGDGRTNAYDIEGFISLIVP